MQVDGLVKMKNILLLLALVGVSLNLQAMESSSVEKELEVKNAHIVKMDLSDDKNLVDVRFLKHFPNLRELDLSFTGVDGSYSYLKFLTKLEVLNLRFCRLSPFDQLSLIPSLKDLTISTSDISKDVKNLKNLKNLQSLAVYSGPKGIERIGELTTLRHLRLYAAFNEDGSRDDVPTLDFLSSLVKLESLDLSGNDDLFFVKPLTRLPKLKELDLSCCRNIQDLKELCLCQSLEKIKLKGLSSMFITMYEDDVLALGKAGLQLGFSEEY